MCGMLLFERLNGKLKYVLDSGRMMPLDYSRDTVCSISCQEGSVQSICFDGGNAAGYQGCGGHYEEHVTTI